MVLGVTYFPQDVVLSVPALFAAFFGVRGKNDNTATLTSALSRARSVRPPGRPDALTRWPLLPPERASYLCSLRSRQLS